MESIKEIASDYIKSHGGYQRRKHLFLNGGLLGVEDLEKNFGSNIFKTLGVKMIKIPGDKNKRPRAGRPKLTYKLNSDGKIVQINSHGLEITHFYNDDGNLIETVSVNEFSDLNDIGRKLYGLTGYHVVKSKHFCNSKKIYKYDKNNKLKRIITHTGPEKYDFGDRYYEEWIKDDVIFHRMYSKSNRTPNFVRSLNFLLFYRLKSLKFYKFWKHIKNVKSSQDLNKKFVLLK